MKVLVTGGAGFIGSHIVDQLIHDGAEVVIVDSLEPSAHRVEPDYINPKADFRRVSLENESALQDAAIGVDAVCHQAARVGLGVNLDDITAYVHDNDAGTASLLRALYRNNFTGRLVVASSMVVYGEGRYVCATHGDVRPLPRLKEQLLQQDFEPRCPVCNQSLSWDVVSEDTILDPRNVYAATKLHTEHLAFIYGREQDSSVCALRYHNVYGDRMPRDTPYAGVASIFRSSLEANESPKVFEDGGQMRDFVHVDDVARANTLALNSTWSGALNIASGEPHDILDMANELCDAMSVSGSTSPRPQVMNNFRLGDVRHVVASPQRAIDAINFTANVSFHNGMQRFATDPLRA